MSKRENNLSGKFLNELFHVGFKNKDVATIIAEHIKPEYLPGTAHRDVLKEFVRQMRAYGRPPTIGSLFQKFEDGSEETYDLLIDIQDITHDGSIDDLIGELENFIRKMMFISSYHRMGELFKKNLKDEAISEMMIVSNDFNNFSLKGVQFDKTLSDFGKRVINNAVEKIRLKSLYGEDTDCIWGIDCLDELTALRRKQVYGIMAGSGGGKTKMLRHIGKSNVMIGKRGLHIQLEGSRQEAMSGYDATFTGIHSSTLEAGLISGAQIKSWEGRFEKMEGEILVKSFEQFSKSPTTGDVRRMIKEAIKEMGGVDFVLIDYLELMDTSDGKTYSAHEERHRRTKLVDELKDIATEFDLPIVVPTQANDVEPDKLNNENFVLSRHNVSEAKGIIKPLTMFITINRTMDEISNGIARLFVDKSRFTKANLVFRICTAYEIDQFYDRERSMEKRYEKSVTEEEGD